jgi:antitoxin (DNA-binding transcriptional repressor) of toxin-antitoxin stability system
MKVYNYSEARQQLAELLNRASREGGVEICRRDGQAFLVRPATRSGSPLDVPGIDAGLSRKEILELVRESRRSNGRLLPKSPAPHQSPHCGKRSPRRQGSALNPTKEEENGSWNV